MKETKKEKRKEKKTPPQEPINAKSSAAPQEDQATKSDVELDREQLLKELSKRAGLSEDQINQLANNLIDMIENRGNAYAILYQIATLPGILCEEPANMVLGGMYLPPS